MIYDLRLLICDLKRKSKAKANRRISNIEYRMKKEKQKRELGIRSWELGKSKGKAKAGMTVLGSLAAAAGRLTKQVLTFDI